MNENISLRKNLKESWGLFKVNYKVLLLASLMLSVVSVAGQTKNTVIALLSFLLTIIFQMGLIKICLDIVDGTKPDIKTMLGQKNKFLKYFLMIILVSIAVTLPVTVLSLLFFLLPLIAVPFAITALIILTIFVVFPRLLFANILIVDTDESAWQAVKTSYIITKKHALKLFTFLFLIIFINIIGALLFGIGLIVTIPISQLMIVKFYRQISAKLMPVVEEVPTEIIEVENTLENKPE